MTDEQEPRGTAPSRSEVLAQAYGMVEERLRRVREESVFARGGVVPRDGLRTWGSMTVLRHDDNVEATRYHINPNNLRIHIDDDVAYDVAGLVRYTVNPRTDQQQAFHLATCTLRSGFHSDYHPLPESKSEEITEAQFERLVRLSEERADTTSMVRDIDETSVKEGQENEVKLDTPRKLRLRPLQARREELLGDVEVEEQLQSNANEKEQVLRSRAYGPANMVLLAAHRPPPPPGIQYSYSHNTRLGEMYHEWRYKKLLKRVQDSWHKGFRWATAELLLGTETAASIQAYIHKRDGYFDAGAAAGLKLMIDLQLVEDPDRTTTDS